MTKIFLGCLGKYLRNNGTESIWIENSFFGPNVVQSVLGGTHYVRSFKGMILLCETMERLHWSASFKTQDPETYKEELLTLKRLQDHIAEKDAEIENCKKSSPTVLQVWSGHSRNSKMKAAS